MDESPEVKLAVDESVLEDSRPKAEIFKPGKIHSEDSIRFWKEELKAGE